MPLLGFIGRLDYQKGADLVLGAAHSLLSQDVQLICLGTGDAHLEVGTASSCSNTSSAQWVMEPFGWVYFPAAGVAAHNLASCEVPVIFCQITAADRTDWEDSEYPAASWHAWAGDYHP